MANATRDLRVILQEAKEIKEKYAGQEMPQEAAEKWQTLLAEGKTLQDAAEREQKFAELEKLSREVPAPALPATSGTSSDAETKTATHNAGNEIAGYVRAGDLFALSPELKEYIDAGMPLQRGSAPVDIKSVRERLVPISRKQRAEIESKAVPTLGAAIIERDRVADVVRNPERDEINLRTVLNVAATGSNTVEWITTGYTRAAAPVADTALKPEAAATMDVATAAVRTLAVWMPVTEQMLQDLPLIADLINSELLYDLGKHEEEQVTWGRGTGQNLLGINQTTGVAAARTVSGDSLVDQIFRASTDIRRAGYAANAVVLDPIDFEAIALARTGTAGGYLYNVLPGTTGEPRLVGLQIVQSEAMTDPFYVGTTAPRRVIVGDFQRGATLWDRQQANVAVGFINDQFVRNMRTIRAEERVAFAVKRPAAFRFIQTQAAVV